MVAVYGIEFALRGRLTNFARTKKTLRKFWKISRTILLVLIGMIILAWLLIQTTLVQNFLVKQITRKISRDLNTTVSIDHVNFDLFNKMLLQGTLIKDHQQDTLLYAGTATLLITDWFFFQEQVELEYVGLKDANIHLKRTDSVWNYNFLIDYFGGSGETRQKRNIDLNLNKLELENVAIIQEDRWRGENLSAVVRSLDLDAERFDAAKREVRIRSIDIDKLAFAVFNYTGNRPPRPANVVEEEEVIVNDPNNLRWNPGKWKVSIAEINIRDGAFKSDVDNNEDPLPYFDGEHMLFSQINASLKNLALNQDSITAQISITTKERSGLEVKQLTANMRMHPEAMEFAGLDLRTNRSRLSDYFAMRYPSFYDMSSFISKVRLEANFKNAEIDSDDIAFFAPDINDWNKRIRITGSIKGSVDNLNGRNLIVHAGQDTYLDGDVSIAGLPEVNKTYIDFEANSFRTTYKDAVAFVPQLRNLTQPRLDLLKYLRFRGNFTGFIEDFVTFGTLETALGTLVTDLNMKLPRRGVSSYSGSVRTASFDLGTLIDNPQFGNTAFRGNISGSGLNARTLNAKLDGEIQLLEFNDYAYRDINVAGKVAKRLFNGELVSADPNLNVQLNGLIDFSRDIPEFDFEASFQRIALKELNLLREDVVVDGKFSFNFMGSNIDNFLGTARVYDASIYRSGRRISFDSLFVESRIADRNKIITALSNEFDAALVGEFSLRDLPAAFQTFLNRYYPSYISSARVLPKNENFSFVISTKQVDDYISLFNENLSGFNNSTLTGRINTKENLLDLNAEITQFGYQNIQVSNLDLKAIGSYDSLSLEGNIGNVMVNDSLNFPFTTLSVRSSNDLSSVSIATSANHTLNAANLAAEIQTLPGGARITFNESSFILNGKNWTIEEDGELVLTEALVAADGIRISSGQQAINVTTVPSDIGNSNDLHIDLSRVNIGDFSPFFLKDNMVEGLLSGSVDIIDPFGKLAVEVEAEADHFRLDDDSIGRVRLGANYSIRTGQVNFKAESNNDNYVFDVQGLYKLKDSVSADRLDMTGKFDNTKIDMLESYLTGIFSEVKGLATGSLRIIGPPDDLDYIGTIQLREGGLRVAYTNVFYRIPSATFNFTEKEINFGSFTIRDTLGNYGMVTRGHLYHNGFSDLSFDFAMNTTRLLVLATNDNGIDPYFGTVIARANMRFSGPLEAMEMDITAEPADSSNFYINIKAGRESGQAEYVAWKVYGREMEEVVPDIGTNLNINLDITANNLANVYVILDELTGDIIRANGRGNLQIRAGTFGDFTIAGRYVIDRGSYNFNFASLLRKPFRLREDVSNYIQWNGDPYNAVINIEAQYEAENVRFSDLQLNSMGIRSNRNLDRYRGRVLVMAHLSDRLESPTIKFRIELPPDSEMRNDVDVAFVLQRIQEDENELNKQVAFLIVFNSFGPWSSASNQAGIAGAAFEGLVVNSISGALSSTLSRQFSNIFQRLFNDKSIRVNFNAQLYSGTNFLNNFSGNRFNIDRTNLNLSIGKSLFNERLTFTFGSAVDFGLSAAQVNAASNLPFLPDISAEWKIRPDGKLVLTFFYRDSYNFISGPAARQNRSGASISYRRDFERFSDIFNEERRNRRRNASAQAAADSSDVK